MRKLIYSINLTLDGCCSHTKVMPDEGVYKYIIKLLQEADVLAYGRITYQLMVPYWPDIAKNHTAKPNEAEEDEIAFARAFDAVEKIVVFSKTLDSAEGKNTRIVRANLEEEILKMKQESGKNIFLGGVDIPSQLIHTGLIDEFHFFVQPIIGGEGRRLFEGVSLTERLQLKLVDSKIFKSGVVALHYVKS